MRKTTTLLNLALLIILPIFLSACGGGGGSSDSGESAKTFTIQVDAVPGIGGVVSGEGTYKENGTFSLQAIPNEGYLFVEWQENGVFVSGDPTLSAKVTRDRSLTALFSENVVEEIKVSPIDPETPLYTDLPLFAQAIYTDGSSKNVTNLVSWSSSDDAFAAFDTGSAGILNGKAQGTVQVSATLGSVSGVTNVTISSPELLSLSLSKTSVTLALGETDFVRADGHYRGGVIIDVTDSVDWTSANEGIASVGNQGANAGLLTSIAEGSTKITASLGNKSAETTVIVNQAALVTLLVSADETNIFEGALSELTALATYTDGPQKDVTGQGIWTSSAPSIATVSNSSPTKGFVSALSSGSVTISVQVGALIEKIILEVVPAPNEPGALTLRALPNVILNNGSDTSRIVATVIPNDEVSGVIADGRLVTFGISSGNLELSPSSTQAGTVSGKVEKEATGTVLGQYDLIAEVAGTVAIDQVTVRVVSSFSDVIRASGSAGLIVNGDDVQPGSEFSASITNASNRSFNIDGVILYNGNSVIASTNNPAELSGGVLDAGETVIVNITLNQVVQNDGFVVLFGLSDTPTTTSFIKAIGF